MSVSRSSRGYIHGRTMVVRGLHRAEIPQIPTDPRLDAADDAPQDEQEEEHDHERQVEHPDGRNDRRTGRQHRLGQTRQSTALIDASAVPGRTGNHENTARAGDHDHVDREERGRGGTRGSGAVQAPRLKPLLLLRRDFDVARREQEDLLGDPRIDPPTAYARPLEKSIRRRCSSRLTPWRLRITGWLALSRSPTSWASLKPWGSTTCTRADVDGIARTTAGARGEMSAASSRAIGRTVTPCSALPGSRARVAGLVQRVAKLPGVVRIARAPAGRESHAQSRGSRPARAPLSSSNTRNRRRRRTRRRPGDPGTPSPDATAKPCRRVLLDRGPAYRRRSPETGRTRQFGVSTFAPKSARPTRTIVAPSSTAISKSSVIPMDSSVISSVAAEFAELRRTTAAGRRPAGGTVISPSTRRPTPRSVVDERAGRIRRHNRPSAARAPMFTSTSTRAPGAWRAMADAERFSVDRLPPASPTTPARRPCCAGAARGSATSADVALAAERGRLGQQLLGAVLADVGHAGGEDLGDPAARHGLASRRRASPHPASRPARRAAAAIRARTSATRLCESTGSRLAHHDHRLAPGRAVASDTRSGRATPRCTRRRR